MTRRPVEVTMPEERRVDRREEHHAVARVGVELQRDVDGLQDVGEHPDSLGSGFQP